MLIQHDGDRYLRRESTVFMYKGKEYTILATFNYFVGNYSFEEHNFSEKQKRRPIQ